MLKGAPSGGEDALEDVNAAVVDEEEEDALEDANAAAIDEDEEEQEAFKGGRTGRNKDTNRC